MPKTKLFISHSSHAKASMDRLTALEEALIDEGYEVLVDKRFIKASDEWRQKIHANLAVCQAALILFDPEALKSPWVLKEATILSWRNGREGDDFKLLPLLFDGVSNQDLRNQDYAPLLLNEIQYLDSAGVAEIVAAVTANIPKGLATPTLFDLLTLEIADQLEILAGNRTIKQVATNRFPDIEFTAGDAHTKVFADRLAREIFQTGPGSLSAAVKIMDEFGVSQNQGAAANIIRLLSPMWVEGDAAAILAELRHRALAMCSLAPQVFQGFTAEQYIARGHPRSAQWHTLRIDEVTAGDRAQHVRDQVRDGIAARFTAAQYYPDGPFAYVDQLDGPLFVLVPFLLDDDELENLNDLTQHMTLLMYTEDRLPNRPPLEGVSRYLNPELSQEDEILALTGRDQATEFLKKLKA